MKSETIYTIDFTKLLGWLLPIEWRNMRMFQWVETITSPIVLLYRDFLKYRNKKVYQLSHNAQVCYLQAVLNDAFDNELRRIRIQNGLFLQALYFYTPPEERPLYFDTQYFYDAKDLELESSDFIVCVPNDLQPGNTIALESYLSDMKALINSYKLASKTYYIKWTN